MRITDLLCEIKIGKINYKSQLVDFLKIDIF